MRLWSHADFAFPLPDGHRYPLAKYPLLRDRVLEEGLVAPGDVHVPEPVAWADLERIHDPDWVARLRTGALDRREQRVPACPGRPSSSSAPAGGPAGRSRRPATPSTASASG